MRKFEKSLRTANIILGLLSIVFFVADAFIFSKLQPKMVRFQAISQAEENLFNWVGIGLLVFAAFYSLSLLKIAIVLKNAEKIPLFSLVHVLIGVISLLCVFGDVALLSDIGKQYTHGLSQPEWLVLVLVMGFQLLTAIIFIYLHLFGFSNEEQVEKITRDSNIFLVIQFVGIICGLMGTTNSGLRFLFPGATIKEHILLNMVILMPYVLGVGYWLLVKVQEEDRHWFDEKQFQDIGTSALYTLVLMAIVMTVLFIANYNHLDGVVGLLWFPLYIFSSLLFFSLGNLILTGRN